MLFDSLSVIAELAAVSQRCVAAAVAGQKRVGEPAQGKLQRGIGQRHVGGGHELVMFVPGIIAHGEIIPNGWRAARDEERDPLAWVESNLIAPKALLMRHFLLEPRAGRPGGLPPR